jgi:hypothetical protein
MIEKKPEADYRIIGERIYDLASVQEKKVLNLILSFGDQVEKSLEEAGLQILNDIATRNNIEMPKE